jgi:aminoglycoside phosphotransferase (APT) family kinase protein
MRETIYYQRGMPDPVLEEVYVLELVRQYVSGVKAVTSIDDSHGEARAYAVDDNIILKVQRPQQLRSSTSLEKEAFFLKHLETQTDVNVPRLLGYEKRGTLEYICMTRIPGIAAERATLTKQEKHALLLELGNELRKIHSVDQKPIIKSGLFPYDDPPDLTERIRRRYMSVIDRKKEKISPDKLKSTRNELEEALREIHDTDVFTALHVNPYIPHVFIDENTHKYSGIIDFGDAYIGHPIFDMWYWSASSRKILLQGYESERPVSPAFRVIFETLNRITRLVFL